MFSAFIGVEFRFESDRGIGVVESFGSHVGGRQQPTRTQGNKKKMPSPAQLVLTHGRITSLHLVCEQVKNRRQTDGSCDYLDVGDDKRGVGKTPETK